MEDHKSGIFIWHAGEQYKKYKTYIENWKNNKLSFIVRYFTYSIHCLYCFFSINDTDVSIQMSPSFKVAKEKQFAA